MRKLGFESLGPREMLTGAVDVAETSPALLVESLSVEAEPDHDSILITNQSVELAQFTMRFNGNISFNTDDLVQQIRDYEVVGQPDMPDYERAYYYLLEFHVHDWILTDKFWIHEPSLYLNSLGVGLCGDAASALKLIWNAMGYESRVWLLDGHVVSEVFTGERWQMYDADLRLVYYNDDGQVAGVEELAANPHYIYDPIVRFDDAAGTGVNHSYRTASFYSTIENNQLCPHCTQNLRERDLIFQIPSGGTLQFGEVAPSRSFPEYAVDVANLGLLTITIPAGSEGSLDIPLALYDVTGSSADRVTIGARTVSLGSDAAFDHFNYEEGGYDEPGQRLEVISYSANSEPIHVHYLLNRKFTALLDDNTLEINHVFEPTQLTVETVSTSDSASSHSPTAELLGDVDGDGMDDTVRRYGSEWWVRPGDGTGDESRWGVWANVGWRDLQVTDVNGDGLGDIVGRLEGEWWVARSTGSSFENEFWGRWSDNVHWDEVRAVDIDADGKHDIAGKTNGSWWVARSTGKRFVTQYAGAKLPAST